MKYWVTSDTHFGHENILKYCPWRSTWAKSIDEHDRLLVDAWNSVVQPEDTVFHLGDFALVQRPRIAQFRRLLHGTITLVLGNHDRSAMAMREAGFEHVAKRWEWRETGLFEGRPGQRVAVMRHDPRAFEPDELQRCTHLLHGHWHGDDHRDTSGLPAEHKHKFLDVGIDARKDLRPADLDTLFGATP